MKIFIIIVVSFLLIGCASSAPTRNVPVEVNPVATCADELKADPVIMRPVSPAILEDDKGDVWVAFTTKHYNNMALNMLDLLSHLKQKNAILDYYRGCINATLSNSKEKETQ